MTVIPETKVSLAEGRRTILRHVAFDQIRTAHDDLGELPAPTIREETPELVQQAAQLAARVGRWGEVLSDAQARKPSTFAPVDRDELAQLVNEFLSRVRAEDIHESTLHAEMVGLVDLVGQAKDLAAELVIDHHDLSDDGTRKPTSEHCDACGAPAVWEGADIPPSGKREAYCEDCARWHGLRVYGEGMAAVQMLGAAIGLAREARLSDAQILAAARETLTGSEYSVSYDIGGLMQVPSRRPEHSSWECHVQRIGGEL